MRVNPIAFPSTPGPTIDQQVFTASGTWAKPLGYTMATIECWAGAGGASSGTTGGVLSTDCKAGGGGAGGGYGFITVPLSLLAATVTVTIGAGGIGGVPTIPNGVSWKNGNAGTDGGSTTFTGWVTANPGTGATGPTNITNATGGPAVGPAPVYTATYDTVFSSGAGRNGNTNGDGAAAVTAGFWAGAGGNGAGTTALTFTPKKCVALGTSAGINGVGNRDSSGVGTAGGSGGTACGGGGGGNGAGYSNASGAGGNGGDGYCRVTCF